MSLTAAACVRFACAMRSNNVAPKDRGSATKLLAVSFAFPPLAYPRSIQFARDAVVTFSQPTTDHLVGLELKKIWRAPWVAHFSDPWVDNPYYATDAATRDFNLAAERAVCEVADRLVFTSEETVDLVTG